MEYIITCIRSNNYDLGGNCIFDPYYLEMLKKWSINRSVLVFDYNGVLASLDNDYFINMYALEILYELKNRGYSIVLWTAASKEINPYVLNNLNCLIEWKIYRENYWSTLEDLQNEVANWFENAVRNSDFMDDNIKENILCDDWRSSYAHKNNKPHQILFSKSFLIDDNINPDFHYSNCYYQPVPFIFGKNFTYDNLNELVDFLESNFPRKGSLFPNLDEILNHDNIEK